MGGIIVAYELGRQLGKPGIFTERKDGVMTLTRGFEIKPGQKVLIYRRCCYNRKIYYGSCRSY